MAWHNCNVFEHVALSRHLYNTVIKQNHVDATWRRNTLLADAINRNMLSVTKIIAHFKNMEAASYCPSYSVLNNHLSACREKVCSFITTSCVNMFIKMTSLHVMFSGIWYI
jgi:hypothetical protein